MPLHSFSCPSFVYSLLSLLLVFGFSGHLKENKRCLNNILFTEPDISCSILVLDVRDIYKVFTHSCGFSRLSLHFPLPSVFCFFHSPWSWHVESPRLTASRQSDTWLLPKLSNTNRHKHLLICTWMRASVCTAACTTAYRGTEKVAKFKVRCQLLFVCRN